MKILAIVITYYPNRDLLERNIHAFVDHVDKVYIWENTPEQEKSQYRCVNHEKVKYIGDGINSISHGLNFAWKCAQENGFDYLLTMDQDSVFLNFETFLYTTIENNKKQCCITGPAVTESEKFEYNPLISQCGIQNHLITSGMLVPVKILDTIGGYCEDFSVDAIDADLCVKALDAGYMVYRNGNGVLLQQFGESSKHWLFGKVYNCRNYSARRLYGIFRNHLILYRRHKSIQTLKLFLGYFNFLTPMVIWENHRCRKMKAVYSGIKDGLLFKK